MKIRSFLLLACVLVFVPNAVSAESVVWNSDNIPEIKGSGGYGWWYRLFNTNVSVTYEAGAYEVDGNNTPIASLACGSSVSVGKRVGFIFRPHAYTDISWFTSGYGYDSPYGEWGVQHTPCGGNPQYVFYTQRGNMVSNYHAINPPTKEVTGVPGSCTTSGSNKYCTLDSPGSFTANMIFRPTTGNFFGYEHYKGCRSTNPDYTLQVPEKTISCSITVKPTSPTPTAPSVTPGGKCVVGTPYRLNITSTDPSGLKIRYGIDWDAQGTIDEFAPPNGYVDSGTTLSASRTFATPGPKTVKMLTQNENGFSSGWTTVNFSCAEEQVEDGDDGVSGEGSGFTITSDESGINDLGVAAAPTLSLRAVPSIVRSGEPTKLHWSATNVSSCVVSGNGDQWDTTLSEIGGNTSRPITNHTTYTLTCIDLSGGGVSQSVEVNVLPVWSEN